MKLKDFIHKLSEFDQELVVCIKSDETFDRPDTTEIEIEEELDGDYIDETNRPANGRYLCIR